MLPNPTRSSPVDRDNVDELTSLATLYYIDGLTQEELSKRFGVSRAIRRMLRRAQEGAGRNPGAPESQAE